MMCLRRDCPHRLRDVERNEIGLAENDDPQILKMAVVVGKVPRQAERGRYSGVLRAGLVSPPPSERNRIQQSQSNYHRSNAH